MTVESYAYLTLVLFVKNRQCIFHCKIKSKLLQNTMSVWKFNVCICFALKLQNGYFNLGMSCFILFIKSDSILQPHFIFSIKTPYLNYLTINTIPDTINLFLCTITLDIWIKLNSFALLFFTNKM